MEFTADPEGRVADGDEESKGGKGKTSWCNNERLGCRSAKALK